MTNQSTPVLPFGHDLFSLLNTEPPYDFYVEGLSSLHPVELCNLENFEEEMCSAEEDWSLETEDAYTCSLEPADKFLDICHLEEGEEEEEEEEDICSLEFEEVSPDILEPEEELFNSCDSETEDESFDVEPGHYHYYIADELREKYKISDFLYRIMYGTENPAKNPSTNEDDFREFEIEFFHGDCDLRMNLYV